MCRNEARKDTDADRQARAAEAESRRNEETARVEAERAERAAQEGQ